MFINEFVEVKTVLNAPNVQEMIAHALTHNNCIDLKSEAENIEACLSLAHVHDKLCDMFESTGTVDYFLALHEIKQIYYSNVKTHDADDQDLVKAMRDKFQELSDKIDSDETTFINE